MNDHQKLLVGVYDNQDEVVQAVEELKRQGYDTTDISVIGKNTEDMNEINEATGTKAEEGIATGAVTGGALGGVLGVLAGVGTLPIPGIGPFIAAGPIAAGLTGAAAGAGAGGLAGALIGMGIPEEDANHYEEYVKEGKILLFIDQYESHYKDSSDNPRQNLTGQNLDPLDPINPDNPINTRIDRNRLY